MLNFESRFQNRRKRIPNACIKREEERKEREKREKREKRENREREREMREKKRENGTACSAFWTGKAQQVRQRLLLPLLMRSLLLILFLLFCFCIAFLFLICFCSLCNNLIRVTWLNCAVVFFQVNRLIRFEAFSVAFCVLFFLAFHAIWVFKHIWIRLERFHTERCELRCTRCCVLNC